MTVYLPGLEVQKQKASRSSSNETTPVLSGSSISNTWSTAFSEACFRSLNRVGVKSDFVGWELSQRTEYKIMRPKSFFILYFCSNTKILVLTATEMAKMMQWIYRSSSFFIGFSLALRTIFSLKLLLSSQNSVPVFCIFVSKTYLGKVFSSSCLSWLLLRVPRVSTLRGQCHEIFCFRFFSWTSFPQALEYTVRAISNFFENSRRYSQLKATGINDTGGKFCHQFQ